MPTEAYRRLMALGGVNVDDEEEMRRRRAAVELAQPSQVALASTLAPGQAKQDSLIRFGDPLDRKDIDFSTGQVNQPDNPMRLGSQEAAEQAARVLNETLPGQMAKKSLQIAGTALDKFDYPLGMPARAVTGGIAAAMDKRPILQGALESAQRVEGKTYRAADVLQKAGMDPVGAAILGMPADVLAGAPGFKLLSGLLGATRAGQAAKSAPMFRALQGIEGEEQAARSAGNTVLADKLAADAARQVYEAPTDRLSRGVKNLFGAGRMGPQQKVDLLRAREASGLPVELADTLGEQGYAGQRALAQIPIPFTSTELKPPSAVSGAVMGLAGKVGESAKRFAIASPVGQVFTRFFIDSSGEPGTQVADDVARFMKNSRVQDYLVTDLKRLQNQAKGANVTPAEELEIANLIERPYHQQRLLEPLNQQARRVLKQVQMSTAGDFELPSFKKLMNERDEFTQALANPTPQMQRHIPTIQGKLNEIQRQIDLMETSPLSSQLDAAKTALVNVQNPSAHHGNLLTAVQDLQQQRNPLLQKIQGGMGLPVNPSRQELGQIARGYGSLFEKILKDEQAVGSPTPRLWGYDVSYMPHAQTENFREFAGKSPVEPIVSGGILQNAKHDFQRHRDLAGMSAAEINAAQASGELRHYRGVDVGPASGFTGKLIEEDPLQAGNLRALKSAQAQSGATYLNYVAKNFHDPNGNTMLVNTLQNQGVPLPAETVRKLAGVTMSKDRAKFVATRIGRMINPANESDQIDFFHTVNNAWKALALSKPGTAVRNEIGNVLMNWQMGDMDRLAPYKDALMLQWASPEKLQELKFWSRSLGREVNGQEVMRAATEAGAYGPDVRYGAQEFGLTEAQSKALGVFLNPRDAKYPFLDRLREQVGPVGTKIIDAGTTALDVARQIPGLGDKNPLIRGVRNTSNFMENNAKLAHFLDKWLDQGWDAMKAGKSANRALIDYGHKTDFIQKYGMLGVPFVMWAMNNFKNQARTLATNPGKLATQMAALNAFSRLKPEVTGPEATDAFGKGEERSPLPGPYVVGQSIQKEPEVQRKMYSIENYLPFADAAEWGIDPVHKMAESGNALVRAADAYDQNRNAYRNRPTDRLLEATSRKGFQGLQQIAPEEMTSALGLEMPTLLHDLGAAVAPQLADTNRLNLFDMFGKPGERAFGGRGAVRMDQDLPQRDRILRYVGGVPSYTVNTEMDQLGYRGGVRDLRHAIKDLARQYEFKGNAKESDRIIKFADELAKKKVLEQLRERGGQVAPDVRRFR